MAKTLTTFKLLCDRCGLSLGEAAAFLDVRRDTVNSWSSGRNKAPAAVISDLRDLYEMIENTADNALKAIEAAERRQGSPPAEIELGIATDDTEAQSLGLPCVGAHAAVLGIVAATVTTPVKIVPRGSTTATAAASDAHKK